MTTPPTPSLADVETALHRSQDTLAAAVSVLDADQLNGPSYDAEWTVADVLSHLGSGAEIFTLLLDAGVRGSAPPEFPELTAVWDRWNAMDPQQQATDSLATNAALLARVSALDEAQREQFAVDMFNGRQDLLGLLQLRLSEHAVHTWDVLVEHDPAARLAPEATVALLSGLGDLVSRAGQPGAEPLRVAVRTEDPQADFLLEVDEAGPRLQVGSTETGPATLTLPAEAFIRLVYGRLDDAHTPAALRVEGTDIASLRAVFPGF